MSVVAGPALAQQSDDFNACDIDPGLWSLVDPVGDATVSIVGAGSGDAALQIDIPGGTNHEAWTTNTAVRALQPVSDVDLSLEAKFDSIPDARYEMQGIIVQQSDDVFLRFEFHWAGNGHYAYIAAINGASASTKTWKPLGGVPRYMRVVRTGNQWTLSWAAADQIFSDVATFTHQLVATEVGPYAGNYASGAAPAFTALVDYFFATGSPITPEDGGVLPQDRVLTLGTTGSGSIQASPDQAAYACNQTVSLTAVPDPGHGFDGWSGDLAGASNPETIDMSSDRTVTAAFVQTAVPPVISNVVIEPGHDSVRATWTTDQPASSRVDWGLTNAYELGFTDDPALVTSHDVVVGSLTPETPYFLQISSSALGQTGVAGGLQTTTSADPSGVPSGFVSDDFNDCALDPTRWSTTDPIGDATVQLLGAGTTDARLRIDLPAAQDHNPWTTNNSTRVLQAVNDTDFSLEAKFDSVLSQGYQMQGLTIQESPSHFLRLEFYHDGSALHAFAAILENGSSTIVADSVIAGDDRIRVTRVGDSFEMSHSSDGTNWTLHAAFVHPMTVSDAGVHAGNFRLGGITPSHTALVDYVFTTLAPIANEDGAPLPQDRILGLSIVGLGTVAVSPDQPSYACNQIVTLTALPDTDQVFIDWSGDVVGTANPIDVAMTSDRDITATFDVYVPPPVISNIQVVTDASFQSATISWDTDIPADSAVSYGQTTGYELGTVSTAALVQNHSIGLAALVPGVEHHFVVSSITAEGGTATSADATFTVPLLPGQDPSGIYTDDFNTCAVDTLLWRVSDPRSDGTVSIQGAGSGDAQVVLSVPAGLSHEPWATDTSLSLLQPTNDVDLDLQVGFASTPSLQYQQQGLLVKQSDNTFLRFEVYSDGFETRSLIAFINGGSPSLITDEPVADTAYLRVERTGDLWTMSTSSDGAVWVPVDTVSQALVADEVGPYAGNFSSSGNAPAYSAVVDYFHNNALALENEDVGVPPGTVTLSTVVNGLGTADVSPTGPDYACGTSISAWATPQPGNEFIGWTGDHSSDVSPVVFSLVRDTLLVANFQPDTTPPGIDAIAVTAGPTGAEVRVLASELSNLTLNYGTTTAYELGTIVLPSLSTNHLAVIQGLTALTDYHFEVVLTDLAALSTTSPNQSFTTSVAPGGGPAGLYSDDFNSCAVDTGLWTIVDPQLDAGFTLTGAGSGDAKIEISVPAGSTHEPWVPVNNAPRLMQSMADTDFEVEVRFDSSLNERYQEQGILVEADPQTYLRFDFHSAGTGNFAFAGIVEPAGPTVVGFADIAPVDTMYMRVARSGDVWTQSFSYDGVMWTEANQFVYAMVASSVGVFAGNASGASSPAHTAIIDYFWTTASPTVPEDVGSVGGAKTLSISTNGPGGVLVDPDQVEYGCGETVTLTAQPDPGYAFDSWSGDLSGNESPETISMTTNRSVTANYVLDTTPPVISNVEILRGPSSAVVTWNTDEPTSSRIDYGLSSAYGLGFVTSSVMEKQHTMVVPGLDPAQTYHLEITATDGAAFETLSGNLVSGPAEGPALDVFYGTSQSLGQNGVAQPMFNLLGNASDPDGVSNVTWSLNSGPESPLSLGWDTYRLDVPGDFNAEIPSNSLVAGSNTILIRATDGLGNESVELIYLDYTPGVSTSLPYSIDWTTTPDIQTVSQVVDGDWSLTPTGLRNNEDGYDRVVALGDLGWTDYEVTARVTLNSVEQYFESPSSGPALGLIVRWPGHTPDGKQPARQWWPLGGFATYRWLQSGGGLSEFKVLYGDAGVTHDSQFQPISFQTGVPYVFKVRVETNPDASTTYSYKLWRESDGEPVAWQLTGTELDGEDVSSGSVLLVNHHVDATWHDVTVTALP